MSDVKSVINEADGDIDKLAIALVKAFFSHIESEKNAAYHAGMRDGLSLNESATRLRHRQELMKSSVDDLEFSVRTANILRDHNITTISQLLELKQHQVMGFKGAGRKMWMEIAEAQHYLNP